MKRMATCAALAALTLTTTGCGCFRRNSAHVTAMPVTTGCAVCQESCGCGSSGIGAPMMYDGAMFSSPGAPIIETLPMGVAQ